MTLSTERLVLRPLTCDEFALLLEGVDRLESALGLIPSGQKLDDETFEAMGWLYHRACLYPKRHPWFANWQIILRDENRSVGSACFMGPPDGTGEVEMGYGLYPPAWGRGYMTEAAFALSRWALAQPGVRAVTAETEPGNPASHRVLEKCGFTRSEVNSQSVHWRLTQTP